LLLNKDKIAYKVYLHVLQEANMAMRISGIPLKKGAKSSCKKSAGWTHFCPWEQMLEMYLFPSVFVNNFMSFLQVFPWF
jgi:hypothetical protein